MRYLNLHQGVLISWLGFAGVVASAACSEEIPTRTGTGGGGSGGAGTDSGASTGGSGVSTAGSGGTGTAGAGTAGVGTGGGGGTGTGGAGTGGGGTGGSGKGGAAGTGGVGTGTGGTGGGTAGAGTGGTGTAGTAGAAGTSGADSGAGVCSGTATRPLALGNARIDDFEDAILSPGWSTFNDVMPTPNSFKITQALTGAIGTAHFGHYFGTGAKTPALGGYGVGATYNMAIDKVAGIYCVDISAFDGVTFWAKALTAASKVAVNFVVPETNAAPDGDCLTGCFLHPSKEITLTAAWAQYSITFAEAVSTTPFRVTNRLQLIGWLSPDANWDFSLDEIRLYKGIPPTGPIRGDAGP